MAILNNYAWTMGGPAGTGFGGVSSNNYQRGMLDPDVERQARAAELPHNLRQQRFDTLLPWIQGQMGSAMATASAPGGASGTGPQIDAGPIWSPQDIQQQVNARTATNDAATQSRVRGMQRQIGASGFGSNSPLAMALQGQYQNQNLQTNTANARDTRMNATSENAGHLFKTQMGRESQYASRMDEDIRRRTASLNTYNALLSALGSLA